MQSAHSKIYQIIYLRRRYDQNNSIMKFHRVVLKICFITFRIVFRMYIAILSIQATGRGKEYVTWLLFYTQPHILFVIHTSSRDNIIYPEPMTCRKTRVKKVKWDRKTVRVDVTSYLKVVSVEQRSKDSIHRQYRLYISES